MQFRLSAIPSPIGTLTLVVGDTGELRALDFEGYGPRMERLLARQYGPVSLTEAPALAKHKDALEAYFAGTLDAVSALSTATNGTAFQRQVWALLKTIPPGETLSYAALAARAGNKAASRAVGLANGANPIAIVVPCHRVIGANGTLTGFGGGLERKRWLLAHEARHTS
ncbi:MAG: methylated-DNA--[protein]-cysteine S-methyltransferase, partial [Pseudomonadota bacterium]